MSGTTILLVALLAGPPITSREAERSTTEILEQKRYDFCQAGNDYQPWLGDQRWCDLAEAESFRRCPGYADVCDYQIDLGEIDFDFELGEGEGDEASEGGGGGEDPGKGRVNRNARKERDPIELPNLGGFARVLMWLLLGVALAAVIYAIYKNLVRQKDDEQPTEEPPPDPGDSLMAAKLAARKVVETDVQRLLARAEAAAAKGDHESAITDAYAALLRRLEGDSLITVDPWKTNGEYLIALAQKPQLRDEVRAIVREVEQVQFGSAAADGGRYASVRRQVLAIVARATLALALAIGLACDPKQDSIRALAGLDTGPSGSRAIGELLIQHDIAASHRMADLEALAQTDGAIVLLEGLELKPDEWKLLLEWVEKDGGMLVVATGGPLPNELGLKYVIGDGRVELVSHNAYDWSYSNLTLRAPNSWGLEIENRVASKTEELLVRPRVEAYDPESSTWNFVDSQIYAVTQRRGTEQGVVVVFASPDLWTNAGLIVADNGAALVNLFRSRDIDEVEFVDDFTGSGADNPLETVRDSKMWAVFLQILLLLGLLYAAVGIPFARLRDPLIRRRRSFVEHVQTLGQRYAQNRAARHVAALYSNWALDRMRERLQPGGSARGLFPLAQAIAARTGRDEAQVMQLLVQAHELKDDHGAVRGSAADLELMRELSKLLAETGSAR